MPNLELKVGTGSQSIDQHRHRASQSPSPQVTRRMQCYPLAWFSRPAPQETKSRPQASNRGVIRHSEPRCQILTSLGLLFSFPLAFQRDFSTLSLLPFSPVEFFSRHFTLQPRRQRLFFECPWSPSSTPVSEVERFPTAPFPNSNPQCYGKYNVEEK